MVEALLGVLDRLQAEFLRDDGQRLQPPEAVLFLVDVLGHQEFHEVPDRRGDHILVVFEVVALLGDLAQGAREIGGHGRLFGDDEGLHEEGSG